MQQAPNSFLGFLRQALRDSYEDVAKEPLPQRFVDLIHSLNERERVEAERQAPEEPTKRRPIH
jgi:Anti-sigma factor NepR